MKFSLLSLALPALFIGAFAAPAPLAQTAVQQKRNTTVSPLDIVTQLYNDILPYTGHINETTAGVGPSSPASYNETASASIVSDVEAIVGLLNDAVHEILTTTLDLVLGPDGIAALAAQLVKIVLEISGTLEKVVVTFGISILHSVIGGLLFGLSSLLIVLEHIVDGLLDVLKEVLGEVLGGLSSALAGLVAWTS